MQSQNKVAASLKFLKTEKAGNPAAFLQFPAYDSLAGKSVESFSTFEELSIDEDTFNDSYGYVINMDNNLKGISLAFLLMMLVSAITFFVLSGVYCTKYRKEEDEVSREEQIIQDLLNN